MASSRPARAQEQASLGNIDQPWWALSGLAVAKVQTKHALKLTLLDCSMSAPQSSSNLATSVWACLAAQMRAVQPSCASIGARTARHGRLAGWASGGDAAVALPHSGQGWRLCKTGSKLTLSVALGLAPRSRSRRATSAWPIKAAPISAVSPCCSSSIRGHHTADARATISAEALSGAYALACAQHVATTAVHGSFHQVLGPTGCSSLNPTP